MESDKEGKGKQPILLVLNNYIVIKKRITVVLTHVQGTPRGTAKRFPEAPVHDVYFPSF